MSKEILAAYKKAGAEFIASAQGLTREQLTSAPLGEWSIAYVVHHLFDAETYFATRYFNILMYENPAIVLFDEELLPAALEYADRDVDASLSGLIGMHAVIEDLLSHIGEAKWQRTGMHPENGPVSLAQMVARQVAHITEHTEQIKALR